MAAIDLLFEVKLESERLHQLVLGSILTRTNLLQRLGIPARPKDFDWEPRGGLFDLRLGVGAQSVWVEIKIDSEPQESQLRRQLDFLQAADPEEGHHHLYLALGTASRMGGLRRVETETVQHPAGRLCKVITAQELIRHLTLVDEDLVRQGERRRDVRDLTIAYRDALVRLESRIQAFTNKPIAEWDYYDRLGFLSQAVLSDVPSMSEAEIGYVSNPRGGFLGCWWHWRSVLGNRGDQIYLQWESPGAASETCLTIRVRVHDAARRAHIRNHVSTVVRSAAEGLGIDAAKPGKFGHGKYMTVAVLADSPLAKRWVDWPAVRHHVDLAEKLLNEAQRALQDHLPA